MTIIGIFTIAFAITITFSALLLMRTREAYLAAAPGEDAVQVGLAQTAAAATGAGVVMVAALIPFATTSLLNVRAFGIGVAIAILFDTLIVRPVLLPAAVTVARTPRLVADPDARHRPAAAPRRRERCWRPCPPSRAPRSRSITMNPPTVAPPTPAAGAQTRSAPPPPTTLGEMLLAAAARHHGVALQYRRDGATVCISYPELGTRVDRDRPRTDRPRHPGRRPRLDPRHHLGRVDARRFRRPLRRRRRGADLPHQLRRGVRLRARPLGRRASSSAETPPRRPRSRSVREQCPEPRARDHARRRRRGETRLRSRSCASAAARHRPTPSPRGWPALSATTWPRSSTPPGTTGPPKGCMLSHANLLDTARMYIERARDRRDPRAVPVPARSRT